MNAILTALIPAIMVFTGKPSAYKFLSLPDLLNSEPREALRVVQLSKNVLVGDVYIGIQMPRRIGGQKTDEFCVAEFPPLVRDEKFRVGTYVTHIGGSTSAGTLKKILFRCVHVERNQHRQIAGRSVPRVNADRKEGHDTSSLNFGIRNRVYGDIGTVSNMGLLSHNTGLLVHCRELFVHEVCLPRHKGILTRHDVSLSSCDVELLDGVKSDGSGGKCDNSRVCALITNDSPDAAPTLVGFLIALSRFLVAAFLIVAGLVTMG